MSKTVTQVRKNELRDWRVKTESVNAATTLLRTMGEEQCLAKQRKHMFVLRIDHILVFGADQNRRHILELFQCTLCHPSHTFHTLLHMADRICHANKRNAHVLVQRSLRCAWGIHCEYVNLCSYPESLEWASWFWLVLTGTARKVTMVTVRTDSGTWKALVGQWTPMDSLACPIGQLDSGIWDRGSCRTVDSHGPSSDLQIFELW